MAFKDDVPNYKTLDSDEYYMQTAPDEIWGKLEAYALRSADKSGIKGLVNEINNLALKPPTQNWGYDWLTNDLSDAIGAIKKEVEKGKFYLLMDTITFCVDYGDMDVEEINEIIGECKIGYRLVLSFQRKYIWAIRDSVEDLTKKIVDVEKEIKTFKKAEFQQAVEHFEQAQKQFEHADNERALKDAVRDCASAMEAIIKICGGENDIKDATKKLRDDKNWGKSEIVKDGDAIFNTIHRLYPDVRHGSTERSDMSLNEARYWIDRISSYVQYMIRQKKILKR